LGREAEHQSEVERVLEARRKVKLLEKLREKGERQHMAAAARQMESEAAELFLAKWSRERQIEA
jgi:hypothetical protein